MIFIFSLFFSTLNYEYLKNSTVNKMRPTILMSKYSDVVANAIIRIVHGDSFYSSQR